MSKHLFFAVFCTLFMIRLNAQEKKAAAPVSMASVEAHYTGGIKEFYKYIYSNFRMPDINVQNDTILIVRVSFIVDLDGCLTNIKVLKDPGFGLGNEAVRVLELCTKWQPGIQNGKPVRTPYVIPLSLNFDGYKPVSERKKQ